MTSNHLQGREVIIEFQRFGNIVKVSAMDAQSLTEVVMQGPASTTQAILKENALKKLEYVLRKKNLL